MINKLIIDSSNSRTPLCDLGVKYPTDKSPYIVDTWSNRRHPYTAIYDFLFSSIRHKPLIVGEIGIESNHSMMCWREYFPAAQLTGWEYYPEKITKAVGDALNNTRYIHMDVTSEASIADGFRRAVSEFDIIIDDATHDFNDQMRVLKFVHEYLKPGGYFIIEDILRSRPESEYEAALAPYMKYYTSATFIDAEHSLRPSGSEPDDKMLVLVRNATPCGS